MKQSIILFIFLCMLSLFLCCGCGSSKETADQTTEAAFFEDAAPVYEPDDSSESNTQGSARSVVINENPEIEEAAAEAAEAEAVVGTFQGLEDNHTAIFAFSGIEYTFYFEAEDVQTILYGAVLGSSYTFSYRFDDSLNLNVIYEISEY